LYTVFHDYRDDFGKVRWTHRHIVVRFAPTCGAESNDSAKASANVIPMNVAVPGCRPSPARILSGILAALATPATGRA
jgi:Ni,Fe-hydrogenase III small subunit